MTLILSDWDRVKLARHPKRLTSQAIIRNLIDDFLELHGDRQFRDDPSIIAGLGFLGGLAVTVIAEEKGSTTDEKIHRNFGMPHPEGYRKALRLMKQAEKFARPILFLIDTPGAYPGIGAEERGQAQAIAENLKVMAGLSVPLIAVIIGEGGSGGALAIGVVDHLVMLQNSIYSILSPEGFAAILFKDANQAPKAASLMKMTADELLEMQLCDVVIPEVEGGIQENPDFTLTLLKNHLISQFNALRELPPTDLIHQRYHKYRRMGSYYEKGVATT